ncbi:cell division cycle protein 23 homolog isoform 1-T1 [Glossina fuscipes fuscipes]
MEDDFFNVLDAKRELRQSIVECQKRGLDYSVKWLAEMCHGLADVDIDGEDEKDNFGIKMLEGIAPREYDNYFLAKSYFDVREYKAAHLVRNASSPVPRFLHLYATYMAMEKRRLDSTTDQLNLNDSGHFKDLGEILVTLRAEHSRNNLDDYDMYLYGVVIEEQKRPSQRKRIANNQETNNTSFYIK